MSEQIRVSEEERRRFYDEMAAKGIEGRFITVDGPIATAGDPAPAPPVRAEPKGPIYDEMMELQRQLKFLYLRLEDLEVRLSPVLGRQENEEAKPSGLTATATTCSLGAALHSANDEVGRQIRHLQNIIDRLEV